MGCFFGSRFITPTKAFFSLVKSKEGKCMKQKHTVQPQDQRSVVFITNPPSALPHDYSLRENNNTLSRHNITKEVKLWNDKRGLEMYERFADVIAIIKATEKLEKLYLRGIVPSSEYETECQQLIFQFKTLAFMLKDVTGPSIEQFANTYQMDCPAALHRLVTSGVPATVEHRASASAAVADSSTICLATVAECVQNFITAMDSLKLNMLGVDQIHPLLSHISASLGRLAFDFEGKTVMMEWKSRLSKMSPADELTEQQAQQLHFDLESSYNEFMEALRVRHYLP